MDRMGLISIAVLEMEPKLNDPAKHNTYHPLVTYYKRQYITGQEGFDSGMYRGTVNYYLLRYNQTLHLSNG